MILGAEGRLEGASGEIGWFETSVPGPQFAGVRYVITGRRVGLAGHLLER